MAADPLSRVFAALADPIRRDMVARLGGRRRERRRARGAPPVSVQAVSKHLRVLQDAGLVSRTDAGPPRAGPPRGGGVRPDDEMDRALPPRGRGARTAASTTVLATMPEPDPDPTRPRPERTDHDHHHQRDDDRGRRARTARPHRRASSTRRPRSVFRAHVDPTSSCSGTARATSRTTHRALRLPHRRLVPLRHDPRRASRPGSTAASTRCARTS